MPYLTIPDKAIDAYSRFYSLLARMMRDNDRSMYLVRTALVDFSFNEDADKGHTHDHDEQEQDQLTLVWNNHRLYLLHSDGSDVTVTRQGYLVVGKQIVDMIGIGQGAQLIGTSFQNGCVTTGTLGPEAILNRHINGTFGQTAIVGNTVDYDDISRVSISEMSINQGAGQTQGHNHNCGHVPFAVLVGDDDDWVRWEEVWIYDVDGSQVYVETSAAYNGKCMAW